MDLDRNYYVFSESQTRDKLRELKTHYHIAAFDQPTHYLLPTGYSGTLLHLPMLDTVDPHAYLAPSHEHVNKLLRFADQIPSKALVSFNCAAGISRSTASCLTMMVYHQNAKTEEDLESCCRWLWTIRPIASPNPLFIHHADKVLGLGEKLVKLVQLYSARQMIWDDYEWQIARHSVHGI